MYWKYLAMNCQKTTIPSILMKFKIKIINFTKHHPVLTTILIDKTAIKHVGDSDLVILNP